MLIERVNSGRLGVSERRSKLRLYLDILRVISSGTTKPTRIMFETNMSWTSMKKALEFLLENELICKEKYENFEIRRGNSRDRRSKERYFISQKGLTIIKFFEKEQLLSNLLAQ